MTEDLQREPDGMPHTVIGLIALFCVLLAMSIVAMLLTGPSIARVGAVILGVVALPVITSSLLRKATRDRDHVHPST